MKKFVIDDSTGPVEFTTTGSRRFIKVTISPGQKIIFSLSHYYASTDNVDFKSFFNFKLPTIFFGKIRLCCVEVSDSNPGYLYLESYGEPEVRMKKGMSGKPVKNIIAWSSDAVVHVKSSSSWGSIYSGDVLVRPCSNSIIVFDADIGTGYLSGALKFIPMLVAPI